MHCVSATFIPRLLTDRQKENRVSISQDILAYADADENFTKNRLGSSHFFLFPTLKTTLKGHNFQDIDEVKENATRQRRAIKQNAFQEVFQKWKKRKYAVASGWDYFEGTLCENDVSYLIKLFYSQFGPFFEHPSYVYMGQGGYFWVWGR